MSDTFQFWTHGVDIAAEYTPEYTGTKNGLYLRRTGWGAQVRQNQGTENWFHLPIPSATRLDDDNVDYYHVWLRVKVNNNAILDRVHVRQAAGPGGLADLIYDSGTLNITGQDTTLSFNLPDHRCKGPLCICTHVKFDGENGEVIFGGAGGWFEEWT